MLVEAAQTSTSVLGVLRHLGLPLSGGNHSHISRRPSSLGVDTTHFTRSNTKGQPARNRRTAADILVVSPPASRRTKRHHLERAMLEREVPYLCAGCGSPPEWKGQPLRLHIDHVNGDWLDNRLGNLRFLCPNCHSQTDTYCIRNRARRSPAGPEAA